MKTNEIIKESEQLDELLGGLKGMLPGGGGYAQGEATAQAKKAADATAKRFTAQWMQMVGANPAATPDQLTNYAQSITKGGLGGPVKLPPFAGKINNASDVQKYIAQAFALSNMGAAATPEPEKPVEQPAALPGVKSPEQIRKEKQSVAATTAQQQMAANPVPQQAAPQSPEQIRQAKQAAAIQQINKPTTTRTGGKVAGQLSQTPGAIKKRQARAAANTNAQAGAGAFGQMATQLGAQPSATPTTVGPGVMPQMTAAPGKVTYNMPAVKPTTPAATPPTEPITIGGQKILPTDPAYAKIMKAYKEPAIAESIFKVLWGKK